MRAVFLYTIVFVAGSLAIYSPAQDASRGKRTEKTLVANAEEVEDWSVEVTLGKEGWMTYVNPRFGFSLPVPPGMKSTRPPDNGGGQQFLSLDGKVSLTAWGSFNVDELGNVETRYKDALAEPGRTITYKRKTDSWYVISGVNKDGTGFYEKYTADKNHTAGWIMTYPQAEEKKYAAWIERIAKDYAPRLGKGADGIVDDAKK